MDANTACCCLGPIDALYVIVVRCLYMKQRELPPGCVAATCTTRAWTTAGLPPPTHAHKICFTEAELLHQSSSATRRCL